MGESLKVAKFRRSGSIGGYTKKWIYVEYCLRGVKLSTDNLAAGWLEIGTENFYSVIFSSKKGWLAFFFDDTRHLFL